jgi:hypothetical protein
MAFEVFDKRMAPLAKAPSITMQRRGIFSITRAAHQLIGNPDTVELLYDRDRHIIALRPTQPGTAHAYALRPQGVGKTTGPLILSATAFTQYYAIDTSESRRFTPYLDDGMMCIALDGPSTVVQGNRGRSRSDTNEDVEED